MVHQHITAAYADGEKRCFAYTGRHIEELYPESASDEYPEDSRELLRFESLIFLHVAKIRDKVVAAYLFRHKQAGVWSKRFSRSH